MHGMQQHFNHTQSHPQLILFESGCSIFNAYIPHFPFSFPFCAFLDFLSLVTALDKDRSVYLKESKIIERVYLPYRYSTRCFIHLSNIRHPPGPLCYQIPQQKKSNWLMVPQRRFILGVPVDMNLIRCS